jgi:hypothetical protein
VLPLVGLLVGLASAGVGWWRRPPVPPSQGPQIVDQGSAEKQFRWALMQVDNEDAFKSVKVNYPHDTIWTPMSDEQLTLLYLKDVSNPQRQKAIQSQIENLRGHGPHANKFAIEAAIAQAYVQVHEGKFLLANQTLVTSGLPAMPPNPESIQGTWRMYLQQVQQEIFQGLRTGEGLGSGRRDDRPAGNRRPDAKNVTSPGDS